VGDPRVPPGAGRRGRADELEALLAADNAAPVVTLAALPGLAERPADATPTPYSPLGFRSGGGDRALVAASGGRVRVQDEGSQLAALALARAPVAPASAGSTCAPPRAARRPCSPPRLSPTVPRWRPTSCPRAAGLVRDSVAAVPLTVPVSEEDGRTRAGGRYDRILVDAPCTGLGALRRRPKARWRKQPADVPELAALQSELLSAALARCVPAASSRTSPARRTSRRRRRSWPMRCATRRWRRGARRARGRGRDRRAPDRPRRPADGSGRAQLWPHRHGTDAMSISLLRRR
jgi:16S rRNA (cytosine967-C5)-methyltransferase